MNNQRRPGPSAQRWRPPIGVGVCKILHLAPREVVRLYALDRTAAALDGGCSCASWCEVRAPLWTCCPAFPQPRACMWGNGAKLLGTVAFSLFFYRATVQATRHGKGSALAAATGHYDSAVSS